MKCEGFHCNRDATKAKGCMTLCIHCVVERKRVYGIVDKLVEVMKVFGNDCPECHEEDHEHADNCIVGELRKLMQDSCVDGMSEERALIEAWSCTDGDGWPPFDGGET